jgi:HEAT repeat protein
MASQDATLRMDAAKALAGIHHELSVRVLAGQMGREQSVKVRQEYIRSLATLDTKESIAAVENALSDKAAEVRLIAVWCLYRLAGAESIPALIRMLSDENEGVRRRAITCIGWLAREHAAVRTAGNPIFRQAISSLVGCLKDPEQSVRIAVFGALEAITGKKFGKHPLTDKNSHQNIIGQWKKWWAQQLFE